VTDEPKEKENTKETESNGKKAKSLKSGLGKYVIFGGVGLLVVVVAAVATTMLLGGEQQQPVEEPPEVAAAEPVDEPEDADEILDSLQSEELDQDVIDVIMDNLAFLDYEPDEGEVEDEEVAMSAEDSVEAVNWLKKEKASLAQKAKELNARQRELELLENKINNKILEIEQAESARTANLAKLYDGMEPRAVAKLMANLDDKTVVAILPGMKTRNASAVLQLLSPQRAAKLSKRMITIAEK
jgi:flagellar motility protein MotE (MotC chaperone)